MQWRPAAARATCAENHIAYRLTGTGFSEFCCPFLPVWLSLTSPMDIPAVTKSHPPTWKCHGQPNIERSSRRDQTATRRRPQPTASGAFPLPPSVCTQVSALACSNRWWAPAGGF